MNKLELYRDWVKGVKAVNYKAIARALDIEIIGGIFELKKMLAQEDTPQNIKIQVFKALVDYRKAAQTIIIANLADTTMMIENDLKPLRLAKHA